ncbi:hypothetical protein ACVW1A_000988 [Bradyrhizobium sp. LB1.3]
MERSDAHEVADPAEPRAELSRPGTGRYVLKALDKPDLDLVMRTGRLATYQNREYLLREGEPAREWHPHHPDRDRRKHPCRHARARTDAVDLGGR